MYLKEFLHAQHSDISKVTIFGPLSDLNTRTNKRNYIINYTSITLENEMSSFKKEEIS